MLAALMLTLLLAACGTDTASEPTSTTAQSAEPTDAVGAETTAADQADEFDPGQIDYSGQPADRIVLPRDQEWLELIGPSRVLIESSTEAGTSRTIVDVSGEGRAEEVLPTDDGEQVMVGWRQAARLYNLDDETGRAVPVLVSHGMLSLDGLNDNHAGAIDAELVALLTDREQSTDADGNPVVIHRGDPEALLEYQRSQYPDYWEWNSVDLEIVTTPSGAAISVRQTDDFVLISNPARATPHDPIPQVFERSWTATATSESVEMEVPIADDADDLFALLLLSHAEGGMDHGLNVEAFENPNSGATAADIDPAVVIEYWEANNIAADRFVEGLADMASASRSTIGVENGIVAMQSASGRWVCRAGRLDLNEQRFIRNDDDTLTFVELTAIGDDLEATVEDCNRQREEFRAGQ
jgi:hypothetical protein